MLSFLEETIQTIQNEHEDISQCILILPSKRAGGFFKELLRKRSKKTIFAPTILSIEEFIEQLSSLKIIRPDDLLIKSYQAYLATEGISNKDKFEEYISWSNALLNDFSEMDRYRVDPKQFFSYLSSLKTLEKWGVADKQTTLITNYLAFWNHLYEFYTQLNDLLLKEQVGYQGMVYRKAADDIEHYITHNGHKEHIFVGFNALNTSEKHIIQELLETGNTRIFWDIDRHFFEDEQHSASYFIRQHLQEWKYYQNNPLPSISSNFSENKQINIVEAPNNSAQVKYLGALLSSYSEEKLRNTAIVLADEALLLPVLYSLPSNVDQANVTMGRALNGFSSTLFFESLLKFHTNPGNSYYYKSVLKLLSHPLSQNLLVAPQSIVSKIASENHTYVTPIRLIEMGGAENEEILKLLFSNWENKAQRVLDVCDRLLQHLLTAPEEDAIEGLVWKKLEEVFHHISVLSQSYPYLREVNSVCQLFTTLLSTISLDFEGDAYSGLQIMGVLETRGIDFENIIMLSVNEGVLPAGKSNASFITYDLKKQFQLPLYTEKDAVYTYHFYRLLHRAKDITLVYNSFSKGLNSGEKSRYLLQLEIERLPNHDLDFKTVSSPVSILKKNPREITKTPAILERLEEIASKYFSPSSLTSYIRNPIDFYYQRILKINEAEDVEETVGYSTLGNIVHDALENLYLPFVGSFLETDKLKSLRSKVDKEVESQFKAHYGRGDYTRGKNLIIFEVAKRY
ncbi:MAG: PD-(D/E)XK nuclease family protein, partial [Flavobacteriaceae bacterium]|nr:PD-(D/E)XK nuclease family protein [Flavobacteriaceae bacterium]